MDEGAQVLPEAQVQTMVGCHFDRLISGTYDIGARGRRRKRSTKPHANVYQMGIHRLAQGESSTGYCLPFVVLAGEGPVD